MRSMRIAPQVRVRPIVQQSARAGQPACDLGYRISVGKVASLNSWRRRVCTKFQQMDRRRLKHDCLSLTGHLTISCCWHCKLSTHTSQARMGKDIVDLKHEIGAPMQVIGS